MAILPAAQSHATRGFSLTAGHFESSQFSNNYGLDSNGNALLPLNGEEAIIVPSS